MEQQTYKIIRIYDNPYKLSRCIKKGLTKEQAMAHCNNPKTSTNGEKPFGENWFDAFIEEGRKR